MFFTHFTKQSRRLIIPALLASALVAISILPIEGTAPVAEAQSTAIKQPLQTAAAVNPPTPKAAELKTILSSPETEPYYADALKEWKQQNVQDAADSVIIRASTPAASSKSTAFSTGSFDGKSDVLLWNGAARSWVEYQFNVSAKGLYEFQASYSPLPGNGVGNPIAWDVSLDGKHPFREAASIIFYREWKDARPILKNDDGDEVRPRSIEASAWRIKPFIDSEGAYANPLKWYLTEGVHTIRLSGIEPVAIEELRLVPPEKIKPYAEAAAAYPQTKPVEAKVLTLQAEDLDLKNDTSIKLFSDTDPRTVPVAKGRITYNTVGGRRWLYQNQEINWNFEVAETGKYKLAMRSLQNQISQKASFRRIRIDGKVPFEEFLTYRFPYDSVWKGTVLEQSDGKPYELYLEKGKHSLSMAVTGATVKPVLIGIDKLSQQLSSIEQDLRALTGGLIDRNRTWKVDQELPDLAGRLDETAKQMDSLAEQLLQVNGSRDSIVQGLRTSAKDIRELLKKLDDVPYYADQITTINEKVNTFIEQLLQQPLQLDEIYIAPLEKPFPNMKASWFSEIVGSVTNFFYSFQSRDSLSNLDEHVLNVWVQRGRDYVDQLQQLTDEVFTAETGIKVKVSLLPTPQLLVMSNAAGIQPDVALGLTQDLPVDYAIRGSVTDLSKLPNFGQIYNRFSPGSWLPLHYNKGIYAIPETQSFQVLFYRKDILKQLGLEIPQTWDDVYAMMPVLQQNSLNFYMNPKDYTPFFYQNNSEFYDQNGLRTALDTPQGFKSFKMWTDLYNTYAVEKEVPSFYQHFRRGTMPIGISDYNMYVQLSAAAPELNNRWGIAEIPGVKQPDGTIERWAGGGQRTGVIFEKSEKKDQAWKFMQWWISTETQARYGNDIEAVNGAAFRWNTSNVEAFVKLPWKQEDANVILKQWSWYKDVPNLPGGYFLEREITNAWLRAVVDGTNYRGSLETAVMDIDRELRRKQTEFGFIDQDGRTIKTLDLPVINTPWKGVVDYIK